VCGKVPTKDVSVGLLPDINPPLRGVHEPAACVWSQLWLDPMSKSTVSPTPIVSVDGVHVGKVVDVENVAASTAANSNGHDASVRSMRGKRMRAKEQSIL